MTKTDRLLRSCSHCMDQGILVHGSALVHLVHHLRRWLHHLLSGERM